MSNHQIHFNRKFYQDKKTGYWISTDSPRIRAHQWVWKNHFNIIPKGYHIHHRNENKSDNSIENLEIIEKSRHLKHHMQSPERKKKSSEMANKYRHLTKAWHSSEEGRAWHRAHGILGWQARKEFEIICKQCGKQAKTKTYHQEVCSNACKSAWRRKMKLDYITKTCPICQNEYSSNKYAKAKTCSRKCGKQLGK